MIRLHRLAAVLMLLAPLACETAGWDFDSDEANRVVVGEDTKETVAGRLGSPRQMGPVPKGAQPGCVERWMYRYAYFGMFRDSVKVLVVDFDADGVVCYEGYAED